MGQVDDDDPTANPSDGAVTLRRWTVGDAPFIASAMSDPAIRRFNGGHDRYGRPAPTPSVADAEAYIASFALGWQTFAQTGNPAGAGYAITEAGSGALLGCCGVDDWTSEDVAQFGYWLAPGARGRGHATRAVILMTEWLFKVGAARAFVTVVEDNKASAAVARRAGYIYEGTMRDHSVWQGKRQDVLRFAALPHEWTSRTGRAV